MRKCFLIIASVFWTIALMAQSPDAIKSDPGYLWAEAVASTSQEADRLALSILASKISTVVEFRSPEASGHESALMATYYQDLRRVSRSVTSQGKVLRYMPLSSVDEVFSQRRRKASEMISYASSSADPSAARTYLEWARVYLQSLPGDNSSLLGDVDRRLSSLPAAPSGRGVHLTNIENEISQILSALSPRGAQQEARPPVPTAPSPVRPHEEIVLRVAREPLSLRRLGMIKGRALYDWSEHPLRTRQNPLPSGPRHEIEPIRSDKGAIVIQARGASLPELSFGAMAAYRSGKWGGYASFAGNFVKEDYSYDCLSDGTAGTSFIWPSGNTRKSDFIFTMGPVYSISGQVGLYAGAGWGKRTVQWEDTLSQWAKVGDVSSKGLAVEGGALLSYGKISFSVGVSSVSFSTIGVHAGVGISIPVR